jgi:20S proteasome alpha/beta subunit
MQIAVDREELKKIVKEAIKEAIEEEKIESFLKSISSISKEEMEDIDKLYGKPAKEKIMAFSEEMEV